jgi:hypothetical protein
MLQGEHYEPDRLPFVNIYQLLTIVSHHLKCLCNEISNIVFFRKSENIIFCDQINIYIMV